MTMENTTLKKIRFDVHVPNYEGDGIAYSVPLEVQAYTDPETGEDVLTPESIQLIEKTQARYMGLMAAEDIKALRHRLALSQQEMSELLQIGAKTYTRWESGRDMPSRSMNVLLCALRDGQLSLNYLRALRTPSETAEWQSRNRCLYLWDCVAAADDQPTAARRVPFERREQSGWQWFHQIAAETWSSAAIQSHTPGKTAWVRAVRKAAVQAQAGQPEQPARQLTPSASTVLQQLPALPRARFELLSEDSTA